MGYLNMWPHGLLQYHRGQPRDFLGILLSVVDLVFEIEAVRPDECVPGG